MALIPCGQGLDLNKTELNETGETPFQAQVKSGWNFLKGHLFFLTTAADVGLS